jgi:hypothetical protein
MNEEDLKEALVNLMYDLHARNRLDTYVLNSISTNFHTDAYELCHANGITYDIE